MSDLASLVVKLEAETSQYTQAIQKASEDISHFGDNVSDQIAKIRDQFLTFEALKKAFDFTENVAKGVADLGLMSQSLGLTTESLSQLQYAAKLQGIDDIEQPLERMARSATAAQQGNLKLRDTFAALGVSLNDLKTLTPDEILYKLADGASGYANDLSKANAIQQIFGRGNVNMVAFLNEGSKAMKDGQQEAILFGQSLSGKASAGAHEFLQDVQRIEAFFSGAFKQALAQFLPNLDAITGKLTSLAKDKTAMQDFTDSIVAGFRAAASAALLTYTAFEFVGKSIAGIAALAHQVFTIPIVQDVTNIASSPIPDPSSVAKLAKDVTHPKDSVAEMAGIKETVKTYFGDISDLGTNFNKAWDTIWNKVADTTKKAKDNAQNNKPHIELPNEIALKGGEDALTQFAKIDEQLKQQIATYGLGTAAAMAYNVEQGKLAETLSKITNLSKPQQELSLEHLRPTISPELYDRLKQLIESGADLKKVLVDDTIALEGLKNVDSLQKIDDKVLQMTGHLREAAEAAFQLSNKSLESSLQATTDSSALGKLAPGDRQAFAQKSVNESLTEASQIQSRLLEQTNQLQAASASGATTDLHAQEELIAVRQQALNQLEKLYVAVQAMATASHDPGIQKQAEGLRDAIDAIQLKNGQASIDTLAKLNDYQQHANELAEQAKQINQTLADAIQDVHNAQQKGALDDISALGQEDQARQTALTQLQGINAQMQKNATDSGIPKLMDDAKQFGQSLKDLDAQIGQLGKTLNDDLVNDASSAFDALVEGTKKGKAAFFEFTADIGKQLTQLLSKALFQKLFDTTGITKGISELGTAGSAVKTANDLLPVTSKLVTSGLAATKIGESATGAGAGAAAATETTTAITTGFATGTSTLVPALSGAFEAGGTAAGATISESMIAAGQAAAAAIATAMGTSSGIAAGAGAAGATGAVALAAAEGGPVTAGDTWLVGEEGPELLVNGSDGQSADAATLSGTQVPQDLSGSQIIGLDGPELIKPSTPGVVIPNDVFAPQIAARLKQSATFYEENPSGITPPLPAVAPISVASPQVGTASQSAQDPTRTILQVQPTQAPLTAGTQTSEAQIPHLPTEPPGSQPPGSPTAPTSTQPGSVLQPTPVNEILTDGVEEPIGLAETFTVDQQGRTSINEDVNAYVGMKLPDGTSTEYGDTVIQARDLYVPKEDAGDINALYSDDTLSQKSLGATFSSYFDQYGEKNQPAVASPFGIPPVQDHGAASFLSRFFPSSNDGTQIVGISTPSTIAGKPQQSVTVGTGPGTQNPSVLGSFGFERDALAGTLPAGNPQSYGQELQDYLSETENLAASKEGSAALPSFAYSGVGVAPPLGTQNLYTELGGGTPSGGFVAQELAMATGTQSNLTVTVQPSMMKPDEYESMLTDRYLKKREMGGPVSPNTPYLVGEDGPEIMVPDSSGSILPNNRLRPAMGMGGGGTVNNYNKFTMDQKSGNISRKSQSQTAAQIARLTSAGRRNM